MKKMACVLAMLAILGILMCGTAMAESSGTAGDHISWTLDDNGTLTFSGYGEMIDYPLDSSYNLLSKIKYIIIEEGITSIGVDAFDDCTNLVSVSIPQSITQIGSFAFYGTSLTSVSIPQNVTKIGSYAFEDCKNLTKVSIEPSEIDIMTRAFYNCPGLKDENGFVIVNNIFFQYYGTAETVTVPESIVRIDGNAFANNRQVRHIILPVSVETIYPGAFSGCSLLESINIPDGVTYIGGSAFANCSSLLSISIPSGVTNIENSAFLDCTHLVSVSLPETLTSISTRAFSGCSVLTDIVVPVSVTVIGQGAFYGCTGLSENGMVIINGALFDYTGQDTDLTIPDTVTSVDLYAFYGKTINSIRFPDTVSTLMTSWATPSADLIVNRNSLTAQTLCKAGLSIWNPGDNYSVRFLYTDDIQTGTALTKVKADVTDFILPEGITSIASGAFTDCHSLPSILLPDDISDIARGAFWDLAYTSRDMISLYCSRGSSTALALGKAEYPFREIGWNYSIVHSYGNIANVDLFYVDKNVTEFIIPEYVTSIGSSFYAGPFTGCDSLTSIIIPDNVTSIGYFAFDSCSTLKQVIIGKNVRFIGRAAFNGCSGLKSITLPYGVSSIGQSAFAGCTNLNSINIPDSVTRIDSQAFMNCTGLSSLSMKNTTVQIAADAFSGCSNLTITGYANSTAETYAVNNSIPFTALPAIVQTGSCGTNAKWSLDENGLLRIYGNGPMSDYDYSWSSPSYPKADVKNVVIEEGITSVGNCAFYGYTNLTGAVQIPNSVATIGKSAFSSCSGLLSISFGSAVTDIQKSAFSSCINLSTVNLPESLQTIGDCAFQGCTSLYNLNFGSNGIDIGQKAFDGCSLLGSASDKTIVVPIGTTYYRSGSGSPSFPSGITPVNAVYNGIYYRVVDSVFMGYGYGDFERIEGPMMAVIGCAPDLTSISIRSSVLGMPVRAIAEYAFTGGTDKGSAYDSNSTVSGALLIPDSVEYIGYNICYEVPGITSIKLGSNVKVIGAHAFNRMNFVSTEQNPLVIPASVEFIGNYAFYSPNSESIVIKGGSLITSSNAFQGTKVKHLSLEGNMQLGVGTFSFCRSLTSVTVSADAQIQGLDIAFETSVVDPSYEADWLFTSFSVTGSGSNYSVVDGVLFNGDQTQLIRCPLGKAGTFVVPNTVTTICKGAFTKCTKLRSVLFTNNNVSIADNAFSGCNLTIGGESGSAVQEYALNHNLSFTIYSVTACGDNLTWSTDGQTLTISGTGAMTNYTTDIPAPWGTSITAVVLDPRITSLGSYCFTNCSALSSISIPEGVTSIGNYVFSGCSGLTQLALPDQIASIGSNTFGNCLIYAVPYSTTAVALSKSNYLFRAPGTEYMVKHTFSGEEVTGLMLCSIPNKSIKEFTIPTSITAIGQSAFSSCTELSAIDIPMSVTSIGSLAFSGCTGLSAINIPASVTSIGSSAFSGCTGLMTINLQHCNAALSDGIFSGCPNTVTIRLSSVTVNVSGSSRWGVCGNHAIYTLKDGTLSMYGYGPMSNYSLSSYTTGDKYDGYTTEYYPNTPWRSLTVNRLEVHEGITSIGAHALQEKTGLTSVSLPNSLTIINDSAFEECTALPSIVIPAHVTAIGNNAFYGCRSIRSICMEGDAPSISSNAFMSVIANVYYCPNDSWAESIQNYGGTLTWIKSNGVCGENTSWILDDITLLRLRGSGTVSEASWIEYADSVTTLIIASDIGGIEDNLLGTLSNLNKVIFEGDVPALSVNAFSGVSATAYYPHEKSSWNAGAYLSYGGNLSWEAYCTHSGAEITSFEAVHYNDTPVADCTTDGYIAHWKCSVCGKAFSDESLTRLVSDDDLIIPAPGHSLIAIEGFPATCTEAGLSDEIFCEVCGETIQVQEEIPALGHQDIITIEAIAPTCTENGHTEQHICEVCGEILAESEVIPATGHTYIDPTIAWSDDGKTCTFTFICKQEDDAQVLEIAAVSTVAEAPGCETMGATLYTATAELNEQTYTKTTTRVDIEAIGHTPVEDPAVPPTDRETGLTTGSHCAACGTVLVAQETIPALWSYSDDGLTATAYHGTESALTIPAGVTALSNTLFKGNTTIASVVIPDSVTTIGTQTFFGASALTDVWLPDSLDGIGTQTFYNTTATIHASMNSQTARALSLRNKNFTDGEWTLRYRVTSLTSTPTAVYLARWNGTDENLVLPGAIGGAPLTQIQTGAFFGKDQLKTIVIPDSVTTIATDAFSGCSQNLVIRSSMATTAKTWASNNGFTWEHYPHTEVVDEAVDPACSETGLTEGRHCSECGEILVAQQEIPASGHTMHAIVAKEATCEQNGNIAYLMCESCSKCFGDEAGEIELEENTYIIPAKGHALTAHAKVEATCTTAGTEAYWKCSVCNKQFSDEECATEIEAPVVIPAKGHTLTAHARTEATCTTAGTEAYWECSFCNKLFSDEECNTEIEAPAVIPAKGHALTAHAKEEATCTTAGTEAYWECSACNKLYSDEECTTEIEAPVVIPVKSHALTAHAKEEATCTMAGTEAYWECSACNMLYGDEECATEIEAPVVIPAKGHMLTAHAREEATCTTAGTEAYWECSACNKLFSDEECATEIEAPAVIPAKGHTLTAHVKEEATCTTAGTEAYWECSACNKLFSDEECTTEIEAPVVIPAKGHTLTAHAKEEATCTASGTEAYWECSVCNKLFSDEECTTEIEVPVVIPAKGHTLTAHAKEEATCTASGTEAHWECSVCNKLYSDEECATEIEVPVVIPAKGHTLTAHAKEEATCTTTGTEAYWECSACNKLFSDEECTTEIEAPAVIPAKGHTLTAHAREEATCTAAGTKAYWECSVCNKLFSDEECTTEIEVPVVIPAKGHTLTAHAKEEATCTTTGTEAYWECSACNELFSDKGATIEIEEPIAIPALNHDLEYHDAKAATCTEIGWDAYDTCKREGCGYTTYVEIPASHDLEHHEAKAATCTEIGWDAYDTCKREGCGYTTYVEIPASHVLEHHDAKAATCTEIGWDAYDTCKREGCGYTTYVQIPALNHDLEHHDAKAATCAEKGWNAYDTCKREGCGYTTYVEIPALNHDLEHHEAKAATCTEKGWNAYDTCKREGCSYTTYAEIPALNHDIVHHEAKAATCTENGWKAYDTCSRCSYTTYVEISAPGHNLIVHALVEPTCISNGTKEYYSCSVCGKMFGDRAGTVEISSADLYIPHEDNNHHLTQHDWYEGTSGSYAAQTYWSCDYCGRLFSDTAILTEIFVPVPLTPSGSGGVPSPDNGCGGNHTLEYHGGYEPTCIMEGMGEYEICTVCGKIFDAISHNELAGLPVIPARSHTIEYHSRVEPTCTMGGTEDYASCSVCGKLFNNITCEYEITEPITIPPTGHLFEYHSPVAPTCTTVGTGEYEICTVCGRIFDITCTIEYAELPVIPASWHTLEYHSRIEPSCTTDGVEEYAFCSVCGKLFDDITCVHEIAEPVVIPAIGHMWEQAVYVWSADNNSVTATRICAHDAGHNETETVNTTFAVTTEPTYLQAGVKTYTAAFRNPEFVTQTKTEEIPKLEMLDEVTAKNGVYALNHNAKTATLKKAAKTTLTKLTIPATVKANGNTYKVTAVGSGACKGMAQLKTVTIGKNVTTIGKNAFSGCKALTKVSGGTAVTTLGDSAFSSCVKLVTVPAFKNLQTIGASAFKACASLTKFTVGTKVKTIGKSAFSNCKALKTVIGGAAVTSIGNSAFTSCVKLTEIPAFQKLQIIGASAFKNCKELTKVTLSSAVKNIGKDAFNGCGKLKTIVIKTTELLKTKKVGTNAFKGIPDNAVFTCPKGKAKAYRTLLLKKGVPSKVTFK